MPPRAPALQSAWLLAARFGAVVDGVALRPSLVDFVVPDPMGALVVQPPPLDEQQTNSRARQQFESYSAGKAGAEAGGCQFRWRG